MKLQEQCCTVEQGKRLVELGVKADSHFSHFKATCHAGICLSDIAIRHIAILSGQLYDKEDVELTPAFNVAELGELLPSTPYFRLRYDMPWRTTKVTGNGSDYWHAEDEIDIRGPWPTEAQARAEILIHLLETKIDAF